MADAAHPRIPLVPGPQVWRLIRTDRDGAKATGSATEPGIPQMTAAFVRWAIYSGTLGMGAKHELIAVGPDTWRFGDVRPLKVTSVGKVEPNLPGGRLLGDRMHAGPTAPSVVGRSPWWVRVEFWWRGQPATIDYPGLHEGLFGRRWQLDGADWVLDRAVAVPAEHERDPGGQTWAEAMGERAEAEIRAITTDLGKTLAGWGTGFGVLALLYLLGSRR